jgi:hypothetical protein
VRNRVITVAANFIEIRGQRDAQGFVRAEERPWILARLRSD